MVGWRLRALDRHLALQQQVRALRSPARVVIKQRAQQHGGQPERRVAHHPVRRGGETELAQVGTDHLHPTHEALIADALTKLLRPDAVPFHGGHPRAGAGQRQSQRSGTGAELDDMVVGAELSARQELLDDRLPCEEILAVSAPPQVASCAFAAAHGTAPPTSSSSQTS